MSDLRSTFPLPKTLSSTQAEFLDFVDLRIVFLVGRGYPSVNYYSFSFHKRREHCPHMRYFTGRSLPRKKMRWFAGDFLCASTSVAGVTGTAFLKLKSDREAGLWKSGQNRKYHGLTRTRSATTFFAA